MLLNRQETGVLSVAFRWNKIKAFFYKKKRYIIISIRINKY